MIPGDKLSELNERRREKEGKRRRTSICVSSKIQIQYCKFDTKACP
uniref:Uncharacterized protein n=1 Tax=Rhizophora mucronata TaxID=61149 RepID=A0A2P2Q2E0_RHIMU